VDEPIKVGDLVVIVGDCCDGELIGSIGTVERLHTDGLMCMRCGFDSDGHGAVVRLRKGIDKQLYSWIRRIPPLSELDDVKHDEEIEA
jgi:hypothetical protein